MTNLLQAAKQAAEWIEYILDYGFGLDRFMPEDILAALRAAIAAEEADPRDEILAALKGDKTDG